MNFPGEPTDALRLVILNLGRRGGGVQLTYRLLQAALSSADIDAGAVISSRNEMHAKFRGLIPTAHLTNTFSSLGPLGLATNFFAERRRLLRYLESCRAQVVMTVMPHVWTPLLVSDIKALGIRYTTIIHDVQKHPGDATGLATRWVKSEATRADLAFTMSQTVAGRLRNESGMDDGRIVPLFHPDYIVDRPPPARVRDTSAPFRLLFFGRILGYKGLPLVVDALELLLARGLRVELCVAGAGKLGKQAGRLAALGATVHNRWFEEHEIEALFASCDAAVVSHVEASQSGIPALAFAQAVPVIATPVGGLIEQVDDGQTGLLTDAVSAASLARSIELLAGDASLYDRLSAQIVARAEQRSPGRFMDQIVREIRRIL